VWAFDDPRHATFVERLSSIFRDRGRSVFHVELLASQAERLRRNETAFRLAEKPTARPRRVTPPLAGRRLAISIELG
jgi:hypothetical protein